MTINKQYAIIGIIIAVGAVGIISFGQVGYQHTVQGQVAGGGGTSMNVTVTNTPDQPVPVTVSNNPLPVTISGNKLPTLSTVCPPGDLQHWDKIVYKLANGGPSTLVSSSSGESPITRDFTYETVLQYNPSNPGNSLENQVANYLNEQHYATLGSGLTIPPSLIKIIDVEYSTACSISSSPVTTAP